MTRKNAHVLGYCGNVKLFKNFSKCLLSLSVFASFRIGNSFQMGLQCLGYNWRSTAQDTCCGSKSKSNWYVIKLRCCLA